MKKTYIAPQAQVYMINTRGMLAVSHTDKEEADNSEVLSNGFYGGGNLWDDSEPAEPEQNSLY